MSNFSDDALNRLQNLKSQVELFCNQGGRICEDLYDVKLGFDALGSNEFASILDSLHSKVSEACTSVRESSTRIDDITNQIDQKTPDIPTGDGAIDIEFEDNDMDAGTDEMSLQDDALGDSIEVDNLGDIGLVASHGGGGGPRVAFMVGDKVTYEKVEDAAAWGQGTIAEVNEWGDDSYLVNFNNFFTDVSGDKLISVN